MRSVKGITCDNGPFVAPEKLSSLLISLPNDVEMPSPDEIKVASLPVNAPIQNGTAIAMADLKTDETAGSVVLAADKREIRYCPPNEFNLQQQRREGGRIEITSTPVRYVLVEIKGRKQTGEAYTGRAVIALMRPVIVLVHGINNDESVWQGLHGNVGLGRTLGDKGFNTVTFNHGIDDMALSGRGKAGALYFRGNGPVELAAVGVGATARKAIKRREADGFVTNRVDLVGHSYGGTIARWYIKTHSPDIAPDSGEKSSSEGFEWYMNSFNNSAQNGLYTLSPSLFYGQFGSRSGDVEYHHVRKLITIGSPWRGTPIANVVNEVYSSPTSKLASQRPGIGDLRPFKLRKLMDSTLPVPGKAPSLEVTAVESRWLRALNRYPFRADIAYEAIAGNDNAYLPTRLPEFLRYTHVDLYTSLTKLLPKNALPSLALERIEKRRKNLSDGLIPVWSAVIEQESPVFFAAHDALVWNEDVKNYVAGSLSNAAMEGGQRLNEKWSTPWCYKLSLPSEGRAHKATQQIWNFAPSTVLPTGLYPPMAPLDRAAAYEQHDGIARFTPTFVAPATRLSFPRPSECSCQ